MAGGTMAALIAGQEAAARADLRSLDLRGADLRGADLSGLDLSGLDFSGANLDGADLSGAILKGARLDGVSAKGANLSGATLVATSLDGADFSNAKFDRAFIGKADEQHIAIWDADQRLVANGVKLDGASFREARLQGVGFIGASAVGADFSYLKADVVAFRAVNLQGANFDGASGRSLSFNESDLGGAALTNLAVKHLGFTSTTLDAARFAGSSFNGASFSFTNLSVADLTDVVREARAAAFNNVNLDGIDFSNFDFSGSIFTGAPTIWTAPDHRDVAGAGPSMKGARFDGARLDYVRVIDWDTREASFAGATVNIWAQGASADAFAGTPGVGEWSLDKYAHFLSLRGVRLPMPGVAEPSAAPPPEGAVPSDRPRRTPVGEADLGDPTPGASPAGQAASVALETLRAIDAQMRASRSAPPGGPAELHPGPGQDGRTLAVA